MTTTSTPSKTAAGVLLALTAIATATVTIGGIVDVSAAAAGQIFIKLGRTTSTALTNEVRFRLEASAKSSGNDEWVPIWEWISTRCKSTAVTTTLNDATFLATEAQCILTSTTGMAAGDILYFRETGTPGDSEWARLKSSTGGTNAFIEEGVTRGHTNGIAVTTFGEMISEFVPLAGIKRVRLVVDAANPASGQTIDVLAWITTLDSVSNT